jgi:hypothetical protein
VSWRVIAASVAGTSHLREQLPCQDSCLVSCYPLADADQALAVVVADGAGSAQYGERGARLACQMAQQHIAHWLEATPSRVLTEQLVAEWFASVRNGLSETALQEGVMLRELACTLLLVLVTPDAAAYGHIGDGGIAADSGAGLEVVFWPAVGEYANMTRFITDEDALAHVCIAIHQSPVQEVAVFTDGIQRLALDFRTLSVHAPFFDPMLAVLRQHTWGECQMLEQRLAAFLDSSKVNSRTDDDKTLVLATRRAALDILRAEG